MTHLVVSKVFYDYLPTTYLPTLSTYLTYLLRTYLPLTGLIQPKPPWITGALPVQLLHSIPAIFPHPTPILLTLHHQSLIPFP